MAGNPPVEVQQYGQSIWFDNISRKLIKSGDLQKLIDNDGVLGVTSNPTIFQKAIGASEDYDEGIKAVLNLDANSIFETLAIEDIQNALDIFRPLYDQTEGRDGYVSLEVSPLIANDTESTVNEAKRLAQAVNRPNLMIKIPATPAGIPAIEEAIYAGINVNVTLIFSVENYLQVAEAFIRGLERRHAEGKEIKHIASVASFFLSRIDVAVDNMLDSNIRAAQGRDIDRVSLNNSLKGKTAIANAKVAYKRYLEIFKGERFAKLSETGVRPQRLLWASTGSKNPAYPDTMYIDGLIGAETVNTVPPDALKAFKDHGTAANTLTEGLDDAEKTLAALEEVGINLDQITAQLQSDGVDSFVASYSSLIEQVDAKRNVLTSGINRQQDIALGMYEDVVDHTLKILEKEHVSTRLWEHDGILWKDNPTIAAKINNRLGWLDVLNTIDIARLKTLQGEIKNSDVSDVVLLGMGGSSLAPEVLYKTFGQQEGFPRLFVLDSTDPTQILSIENAVNLEKTLFIVSSKSGGTIETSSFYQYFYAKTGQNGSQFIAITDPDTSLEALAREKNFRDVFLNPADIGGRYSALSYFGMVPAALIGLDLDRLWSSAEDMIKACSEKVAGNDNPGLLLGAIMGALGIEGCDKVTLLTTPSISSFGSWVEQLIAESTGKEGKGLVPVVGASIGKPHDYSSDRLFVYLKVEGDIVEEDSAAVRALREAGHPRISLSIADKYALGGEFFRWEYATAIAGKVLEINPFDEPNVTESKENTSRLLQHFQEHGALPQNAPVLQEGDIALYVDDKNIKMIKELARQHNYDADSIVGLIAAPLNSTYAGDYFALLAYTPVTDEINSLLEDIRRRLRHGTRRAVTLGYGPRFLHSTGQLHKGGANNGVFIQITCDDPQDVEIPGAPYSFGVLKAAQAAGDIEALVSKSRRVIRLHVGKDIKAGLVKLRDAIDLAVERRI